MNRLESSPPSTWCWVPSRKTVTAMAASAIFATSVIGLTYAIFSAIGLHNYALLDAEDSESTALRLAASTAVTVFNGAGAIYWARNSARSDLTILDCERRNEINPIKQGITPNSAVFPAQLPAIPAGNEFNSLGANDESDLDLRKLFSESAETEEVESAVGTAEEASSPWPQIQFSPIAERWILDPEDPYYSLLIEHDSAHCPDIETRGIQIYQANQENAKTLIFSKSTCLSDLLNLDTIKELMFWNGKLKKRSAHCIYATAFFQSKIPDSYLVCATKSTNLPSFYPGLRGRHHQFGFMDPENGLYLILDATIPKRTVERYNSILILASSQEELADTYQCVFGLDYSIHKTTEEEWLKDHRFPRDQVLKQLELDLDPEC